MRNTVANAISRVRIRLKALKQDAFLTDRFLYSVLMKHAKALMKREDGQNKLMKFNSVFQTLDFVELEEVDKIQAVCAGISSGITIKRTKNPLPTFAQGYWGPLIRAITAIDGSGQIRMTTPTSYAALSKSTNFKYNKAKYCWFLNDYLYFPDLEWDAVRIEGIFEDDISAYTCSDRCVQRQDLYFNVPDYLFSEMEGLAMRDLGIMPQMPGDDTSDKHNNIRP